MVSAQTIARVQALIKSKPVFIASKTYCPYCQRAKKTLFQEMHLSQDKTLLLELDEMDDGADIQDALRELSGQTTVPNIYISGEHVGGNDDLQAAKRSGHLKQLLDNI